MGRISVTILNWDRYNPRKDYANPTWFRLSHSILEDPDFVDFAPHEFHALIYIFCQVSKKNTGSAEIVIAHAQRLGISEKWLLSTIDKMLKLNIITDHVRNPSVGVQDLVTTYERTNVRTNVRDDFDFEKLYDLYPRKAGKAEGLLRLRRMKMDKVTFDMLEKAIKEYARICKLERTDQKYVKHFSSFLGTEEKETWRDYIPMPPKAPTLAVVESNPEVEAYSAMSDEDRKVKALELNNALSRIGLKSKQLEQP